MNVYRILILILIILILFIYLIIYEPGININKLFEINYLKKKYINLNKKYFIIKKEHIKENNDFYDGKNILLYPGFKKNTIDVGDILFDDKTYKNKMQLLPKIVSYIQNNKLTHVLIINSFRIDNKNVNNFEIPNGYKLINPIIIQSAVNEFNKLSLNTKLKSTAYIGKTTLYEYKKRSEGSLLHSFRYKDININLKKNIYNISNYYEYVQWNKSTIIEIPLYRFYVKIMSIIQKIFQLDYYDFMKKINLFYLKNINIDHKNNLIDPKQINKINDKIKIYLEKMKKDKKNKDTYLKIVKKLLMIKSTLTKGKHMTCSQFIHYIYKINNIDLLYDNSFGIDNINYSKFITPRDLTKIIFDNRFEYTATF
jgi:hypothetical protein